MDSLTTATNSTTAGVPRMRRRTRTTSAIVAGVLALGVVAGTAACSGGSGEDSGSNPVATANASAARESNAAQETYQALATSVTTGMDLLAAQQGKVSDAILGELSQALDTARAINPVNSYRDAETAAEAEAKQEALTASIKQMTDAKNTLDAAIRAVQAAATA